MKIGIIGFGVVGKATHRMLQHHTKMLHPDNYLIYDPAQGFSDDTTEADIVFICVPAPTKTDGTQDLSAVRDALLRTDYQAKIFIRTSVLPGSTRGLNWSQDEFRLHLHAMPEFLTEKTANEDAVKLPVVCSRKAAEILKEIMPHQKYLEVDNNEEAELVKYVHNCFCAVKVGFFNNIYRFMQESEHPNFAFERVVEAACGVTGFIEPTHTKVPGPDGQLGFGGKCLPKDLFAFATQMEGCIGHTFLRTVFEENFFNRFGSLF